MMRDVKGAAACATAPFRVSRLGPLDRTCSYGIICLFVDAAAVW